MTELAPGLHLLKDRVANAYLYATGEELTLIDSGIPRRARKILNYVRSIGHAPSDLKRIVITHADWDHAGSAAALQKETGAQVIAGAETARWLQRGTSPRHLPRPLHILLVLFARYAKVPGAAITTVEDGQRLAGPGNLTALATPGHTPDHFAFFDPSTGILFAGDALQTRRGTLGLGSRLVTGDVASARNSARQLLSLTPAMFACGHGPPLSGHDVGDVMHLLRQLESGAIP
ncbi:MAG TPA: MBL fold metallo-hydrolase [Candidatus Sulfomarinibacteraceae bacterium]|nr:MBL fold metallo-hydrolase [Candidatus Sulfomarinibacteraceae bacterium]